MIPRIFMLVTLHIGQERRKHGRFTGGIKAEVINKSPIMTGGEFLHKYLNFFTNTECSNDSETEGGVTPSVPKGAMNKYSDPTSLSTVDKTKITDRCAMQIIAPVIHDAGNNIDDYRFSCSSMCHYCLLHRTNHN